MTKSTISSISQATLAKLLMLSTRQIRNLTRDGVIPRLRNGTYATGPSIQAYFSHLEQAAERRHARSADLDRLRSARAREIELRIAEKEKRLCDTEMVFNAIREILNVVRDEFGPLAANFTAGPEKRARLQGELDDIFARADARIRNQETRIAAKH